MVRDKAFGIPEHGMHENSCGHDLNYDCTVFISSHFPHMFSTCYHISLSKLTLNASDPS